MIRILTGDCRALLATLPDASVQSVVTSPPYYGLRDYGTASWQGGDPECAHVVGEIRTGLGMAALGAQYRGGGHKAAEPKPMYAKDVCPHCGARRVDNQIGLEPTPDEYVAQMIAVFREVRRVLRDDGTLWLNLGSSYAAGGKPATPSRQPPRVFACDNGGKALEGCLALDCACHGQRDERRDDLLSRHENTSHSNQRNEQFSQQIAPTVRDNEHQDFSSPPVLFAPDGVLESTKQTFSRNGLDAFCPEDAALGRQEKRRTFLPASPLSVDTSVCTCGIQQMSRPSAPHTLGKVFSAKACCDPKCQGCGICWAYLAIPSLRFKSKDLMDMPALLALALQADGWYLRSDIIWHKPNPMPESVRDRPTSAHEHVFLLTKRDRYFYDADAISEEGTIPAGTKGAKGAKGSAERFGTPGVNSRPPEYKIYDGKRNARNVWTIATRPYSGAHFATMPPDLVERCVKAGTSEKGACPSCGAPWVRQTEVKYENPGNRTTNGPRSLERRHETAGFAVRLEKRTATLGWEPSCSCPPADPVPCVVLDPFGGAGTTGLVAQRLGRHAVLLELNAAYADMARTRINADGDPALLSTKLARAEQAVERLTRALTR